MRPQGGDPKKLLSNDFSEPGASSSAIAITISSPIDAATTLDLTMTRNLRVTDSTDRIRWSNIGDYVTNDEPDGDRFNLTEGITANGTDLIHIHSTVAETLLDYDPSHPGYDDFHIYGSSSAIS